jgi:sn-glycerol 3-phosphate transport system ATP-binding protein
MSRIDIHELVKQWGDVSAVDKVSFTVPEGSLTVLLGPSGCGKSTILRLIAGLEAITAGSISIGGKDVTHLDPAQRGVSMVFQSYALFPHLTVRENILFGLKVRGTAKEDRRARLAEAARMVGLSDLLIASPRSSPAGSGSGWRWRAPSCRGAPCVSWTSRSPTWTPNSGRRCATKFDRFSRSWA